MHRLTVVIGATLAITGCVTAAEAQNAHQVQEIVFETSAGARLAGTLTLPDGEGPHPAALIVSASGPHVRNEARRGGHHWAELAARLADVGLATLRCDARGVGGSASEAIPAWEYKWTPAELADDSRAALKALRDQAQIDPARIGLIAFSDGVPRAAMIASDASNDVAFTVLLSASGVSAGENLRAQTVGQAKQIGKDETQLDRIDELITQVIESLIEGADREDTLEVADSLLEAMDVPAEQRRAVAENIVDNLSSRGARAYLALDPSTILAGVACPVLSINGGADNRTASPDSLPTLFKALDSASRTDVSFVTFGGLNHFLEPPEPLDPPVFDRSVTTTIIVWLRLIDIVQERP